MWNLYLSGRSTQSEGRWTFILSSPLDGQIYAARHGLCSGESIPSESLVLIAFRRALELTDKAMTFEVYTHSSLVMGILCKNILVWDKHYEDDHSVAVISAQSDRWNLTALGMDDLEGHHGEMLVKTSRFVSRMMSENVVDCVSDRPVLLGSVQV